MNLIIKAVLLSFLLGGALDVFASDIPPRKEIFPWGSSQYEVTMPAPYGVVKLLVDRGEKNHVNIVLKFRNNSLELKPPEGVVLTGIQKPEITYDYPSEGSEAKPSISIYLEYGPLVEIKFDKAAGSAKKAKDWARDIIVFTVTNEGRIESRLHSAKALN